MVEKKGLLDHILFGLFVLFVSAPQCQTSPKEQPEMLEQHVCFKQDFPGYVTIGCTSQRQVLHVLSAELGSEDSCKYNSNCLPINITRDARHQCNGRHQCHLPIKVVQNSCQNLVNFIGIKAECRQSNSFLWSTCYNSTVKEVELYCPNDNHTMVIHWATTSSEGLCASNPIPNKCVKDVTRTAQTRCTGFSECYIPLYPTSSSSSSSCNTQNNYIDVKYTCVPPVNRYEICDTVDKYIPLSSRLQLTSPLYPEYYSRWNNYLPFKCGCMLKLPDLSVYRNIIIKVFHFQMSKAFDCAVANHVTIDSEKDGIPNRDVFCGSLPPETTFNISSNIINTTLIVYNTSEEQEGFWVTVKVNGQLSSENMKLVCGVMSTGTEVGTILPTGDIPHPTNDSPPPTNGSPPPTNDSPPPTNGPPPPTRGPPPLTGKSPSPTAEASTSAASQPVSSQLGTAVIIGVSVGGAVVLIIVIAVIVFCCLKWKRQNSMSGRSLPPLPPGDKFENLYPGPATAPRKGIDNLGYSKTDGEDMYETIPYDEYDPSKENKYIELYGGSTQEGNVYLTPDGTSSPRAQQNDYVGLSKGIQPPNSAASSSAADRTQYESLAKNSGGETYVYASQVPETSDPEKTTSL